MQRALAEGRLVPDAVEDFERLIIAQPNSSFLWIQYIAFHVKNADLESARSIGNRALRTINFREDKVDEPLDFTICFSINVLPPVSGKV